jgi:hypothetical protein
MITLIGLAPELTQPLLIERVDNPLGCRRLRVSAAIAMVQFGCTLSEPSVDWFNKSV